MRIKERQKDKFFIYLSNILNVVGRKLFNKKTKNFTIVLFLISTLLVGFISGLFISGFFGTLDKPSQKVLDVFHSLGIYNLRTLKAEFESITAENIKIPYNYLKGQFSKPEKIFIDIKFKDFQKLEYKRQQALDLGAIINSGEDFVPAKITYNGEEVDVKLRLKGDFISHIKGDKWSFRIKIKDPNTLFGMKTFSIQNPSERNYLHELIYHKALKKEEVLSLRYDFIEVVINGENKGIYALEEHFEKQLIESNNRREGVILKFSDNIAVDESRKFSEAFNNNQELAYYRDKKQYDFFYTSNIQTFNDDKILLDPVLSKQFIEGKSLLESFRSGDLKTSEIFDTNKLSTYFALNTVLSSEHGSQWGNIRFYYNPITSKIEPIGYDSASTLLSAYTILESYYLPECFSNSCDKKQPFLDIIFKDPIFYKKYIQELERVSEKEYLDSLFSELNPELKTKLNIIHKDKPSYHFSLGKYYQNQIQIQNELNPIKAISAYTQEKSNNKITISAGNNGNFPLEIISLVYENSTTLNLNQTDNLLGPKQSSKPSIFEEFEFNIPPSLSIENSDLFINYKIFGLSKIHSTEVLPYSYVEENFTQEDFIRKAPNFRNFEFLVLDENSKAITINQGSYILDKDLIIPRGFNIIIKPGVNLDLINSATILSYSNMQFQGTQSKPIKVFSSDKTGQGITILNSEKRSNLKHVIFENIKNPEKPGWNLTGSINIFKSPVSIKNSLFQNINSEDCLNIIDSEFHIENTEFNSCSSDCFDNDFGSGILESSSFYQCGNDALDFSGTTVEISDVLIEDAKDKAISIGEKSNLIIKNIQISTKNLLKTFIGIASKDSSQVTISDSTISDTIYGLAIYRKKSEYGPANIISINNEFTNVDQNYILEKNSGLSVNNVIILDNTIEKVYKILYL